MLTGAPLGEVTLSDVACALAPLPCWAAGKVYDAASEKVDQQKDALLDEVEGRARTVTAGAVAEASVAAEGVEAEFARDITRERTALEASARSLGGMALFAGLIATAGVIGAVLIASHRRSRRASRVYVPSRVWLPRGKRRHSSATGRHRGRRRRR